MRNRHGISISRSGLIGKDISSCMQHLHAAEQE